MRFNPKSEEELQAMNLIEPGTYSFEVIAAKDRISKKGNEMIEVQLKIWDIKGHERVVYDYLLESMAFKLKHFSEVCGLSEKYVVGELKSDDCIGKQGKVELIIQQGQQKPEGGYYPDKNSVKDYIKSGEAAPKQAATEEDPFSDEIPF